MSDPLESAPAGRSRTPEPEPAIIDTSAATVRRAPEVPIMTDQLAGKYIRVGNKLFRTADDKKPIVRLAPDRLTTSKLDVLPDLIRLARANGWTAIRVSGGDQFQKAAFLAAASQGMAVENYKPSKKLAAEAEQLRNRASRRRKQAQANISANTSAAEPAQVDAARVLAHRFLIQRGKDNARDPELWQAQTHIVRAEIIARTRFAGDPDKTGDFVNANRLRIAARLAAGDTIAPVTRVGGKPLQSFAASVSVARERDGRSR